MSSPLARTAASVPSGESPDGTGESRVLPISEFSNPLLHNSRPGERADDRAYCYHLKDYRVVGSMISFSVVGAPLGEGALDLDGCLRMIFEKQPVPPLFVETWTPSENNHERDVALDADWLHRSVQNLCARLAKYH